MDTKQNKNSGITFFALAFIASLLFELYFILNDPTNYFMLIGVGVILLITGYLTFDSLERAKAARAKAAMEQNELMVKAGKAIYLATKRNSQEAEKQHVQSLKAIEIMMNKLMLGEKEMINKLIAQNEEIATKQLTTSAPDTSNQTDMSSLIEQLSASNAKLAKEVQSAITVNELVKANADLVRNVREVLNNSSGLNSETISAYVANAVPDIQVTPTQNAIPPVVPVVPVAPVTPVTPVAPVVQNVVPQVAAPVVQNVTPVVEETQTATTPFMMDDESNPQDDFGSISDIMHNLLDNSVDAENYTFDTDIVTDSSDIDFDLDNNFSISNTNADSADDLDSYDQHTVDEFDFESFEIADNTSDTVLDNGDAVSAKELVDDINISALNDMVAEEGSVIAPAISEELDKEMSQGEAESVLSGLDDSPNRQLTEAEIAALFANI